MSTFKEARKLDFNQVAAFAPLLSDIQLKKNLADLTTHLVNILVKNNADSETTAGRNIKLDFKIGTMLIQNHILRFDPISSEKLKVGTADEVDSVMGSVVGRGGGNSINRTRT